MAVTGNWKNLRVSAQDIQEGDEVNWGHTEANVVDVEQDDNIQHVPVIVITVRLEEMTTFNIDEKVMVTRWVQ